MKIKFINLIIALCFFLSFSTQLFSQNNLFIGTWKYEASNEIFYVTFYNESNKIRGNYRKVITDNNGLEIQEVYRSNKFLTGTNVEWPSCIRATYYTEENIISGSITDNTIDFTNYGHSGRTHKTGILTVKLLSGCVGCPLTAEWKVERGQGIQLVGEPDYNIPTDIVLTKVQ